MSDSKITAFLLCVTGATLLYTVLNMDGLQIVRVGIAGFVVAWGAMELLFGDTP